jgi:hypothetical protein
MTGGRKTMKIWTCPHCYIDIKARGYTSHEKSCNCKWVERREDAAFHRHQLSAARSIPPGEKETHLLQCEVYVVHHP